MRKILKEINIYNFEELKEEINIYNFEELKEEIQNKLINDFRENLINDNFEMLSENYHYILKENYKLYDFKIEYSLSYSQDDGVCFYNDRYNLLSYTVLKNNDIEQANVFERYIIENNLVNDILLNYLNDGYNLGIFKNNKRYTHAHTCIIDYECYYNNEIGLDEQDLINDYILELKHKLYDVYLNICKDMEKIGYSCYEVTDEEVKEYIDNNDYEFLEDGIVFNG